MRTPKIILFALLTVLLTGLLGLDHVAAKPDDPACEANVRYPRRPEHTCAENIIIADFIPGVAVISALAFGPEGALYYASPANSAIMRIAPDESGTILVKTAHAEVFAADLPEMPTGLTYYRGSWYVSSDTMIVRLRDVDNNGKAEDQQIIVRDLPGGVGGWLGNLHVGPDGRLYVTKGASCEACTESDPHRAVLLSYALDGSDSKNPQIVAKGLHDSFDFAWAANGDLVIADNERPDYPGELNVIPHDHDSAIPVDFGWPRCAGAALSTVLPSASNAGTDATDCTGTATPAVQFPVGSHPMGVVYYNSDTFPDWKGGFLVALSGSWNATETTGYSVWLVGPADKSYTPQRVIPDQRNSTYVEEANAALAYLSFYPEHPVGLAVSAEGWLYMSTREGRIMRLRPHPLG